jgi:phenylacetate-CoA ligase
MNPLIEKIYYKCPIVLQNFAIGVFGYKLDKERFQPEGHDFFKTLQKTQDYSKDEMKVYHEKKFVELAQHAINNTAYYKEWSEKEGISSADISTIDDLNLFPIIEKQTIRENPELFRAKNIKSQFILNTSGTTGTPLNIYTDKISRSKHYAFFTRLREKYDIQKTSKRCTLFGRIIMLADQEQPPFWRYDWYQRNLLMSSYHLKENNLKDYYTKLVNFAPEEIFTYPSSITPIAEFIVKNSLSPIKLKLIMTTAENLSDYQRAIINKAFNAPIVNQYGCTEMAFFMGDNGHGMLIEPEHGIVEVRSNSGNVSLNGEGELIATGLINWSMPVIRYAVGDDIELTQCNESGRQKLASLKGRVDDVLYQMDGTPVGRLDPIFKGGKAIQMAQIVQKKDGSIILKLVPSNDYQEQYGNDLKVELCKRFGDNAKISIELLDDIPKQKNGKFRAVISEFSPVIPYKNTN